jgi:hypothetical protein
LRGKSVVKPPKFALNDARITLALGRVSHALYPAGKPTPDQNLAQWGRQEDKPDRVGKKPRRQQQSAGDEQRQAFDYRYRGQLSGLGCRAKAAKRGEALPAHQRSSHDRGSDHASDRPNCADDAAYLNQEVDFQQWDHQECQE